MLYRRPWSSLLPALLLLGVPHLTVPSIAAAQELSEIERRLVEIIDSEVPDALALLERAVNLNSGTMNFAGVEAVGRLFRGELEALDFSTRWVEGAPWDRAGHLIAEWRSPTSSEGDDDLHVLLIGHLDTVFEPDSPFQRFETLSDSTARGPGIIDMKGGNVIMLLALKALRAAGALERLSVTVVLTGDEEKPGRPLSLARRNLLAAAEGADVAIGFEDGDGDPRTAVVARRGNTGWRLRTAGRPAHSSQVFREDIGSGAIYEAARILTAFHDSLAGEPLLTFNPGVILGGTAVTYDAEESGGTVFGKTNVIAESTVVAGDLRTVSPEQRERAKRTMRRIVTRHYPQTSAEIVFSDGYPPMAPSEGNLQLLALYDQASRDLGFGPVTAVDPARAGAADVSFTAERVEMALDGVGLMGDGGHTIEETADLRTLSMQAKRAAVLLWRLCAGDR
jgi:glutamate carboxypeptidase